MKHEYKKQVEQAHYDFSQYVYPARWMSYYYQLSEVISHKDAQTVLDIGPGTAFTKQTLAIFVPHIQYQTLDVSVDVCPDFIGSVTAIPLESNSFDLVCAFQVLEHIDYTDFSLGLSEIARVSKKYAIISLPHFGPSIEFTCKVPFFPRLKFAAKIPFPKKHIFNGQHYWEIGKRGYSPKKIRNDIKQYFNIVSEYVPFENQYHRFYILEVI